MKKFLFFMLALLGVTQMAAQEYEYVPFVREGVKWVCYYNNSDNNTHYTTNQYYKPGKTYFTLELKGDVEINGNTYKAMHKYSGEAIDPENDTVLIYLREQDKVVYGIVPDYKTYPDFFIGYGTSAEYPFTEIHSGNEFVLYDFSDMETWCQWIFRRHPERIVNASSEMIDIAGKPVMRHSFVIRVNECDFNMYFIEGIGVDGFHPYYPLGFLNVGYTDAPFYLSHVIENGETIYKGVNYEYIAPWDGRLPIAREGMKWVNERVIINNGDTTRYYYTYEIQGNDNSDLYHEYNGFMNCHYYTGKEIDPDNDSIICSIAEVPNFFVTWVTDNRAMDQVEQEGRNILQRKFYTAGPERLYFIRHDRQNEIFGQYYSWQVKQKPYFINRQNFVQVEPVEIDGHECCRYAYLGEDGEPMAYLVEGIGFDSRDMGDLLTPFTRKPDHDADYQEYWGLSHVIKDGRIIYKGMRYRGETEEGIRGDVNGDGNVDIGDVTLLIDVLLNSGNRYSASCDVDSNNEVGISDVTTLIDLLLNDQQ